MTNGSKKFLVTRRRREFFVLRRRFRFEIFCETCASESEFVSLDEAVLLSGASVREIVRRVERGEFHFSETVAGHLFVCGESLRLTNAVSQIKGENENNL